MYPKSYDWYLQEFVNWKDPCPFSDVKCPTFIVHGDKDGDPITHSTTAHEGIAGSKLRIIEGAWHYMDFHPEFESLV